ncbi:carboxypeptidase S [Hypoxylon trugodes]|uniref:carboxypeptidase S n=1 Tax=Hypoxylon trugodes TaxID=326681 RepID=UPI00218FE160|nr:carboxypeptidase S [Hypoxylon trugodes]KAI1386732.1 carboxypeptidase S [Hypoxylon trugodes]
MEKHQGSTRHERRKSSTRNRNLLFSSLAFCLIIFYFSPSFLSRARHCFHPSSGDRPDTSSVEKWCPLPDTTAPADDGLKDREHFINSQQLQLQVKRLSEAVQVPTESFDDNGEVDEDSRWETFQEFHQVLEKLFPLTHSKLDLRKVNRHGLLYTFKGTDATLKPILFTAHQDVVPAGPSSRWKYPPFEGHFDGSFVWGRGAADCKNVLIGLLSAIEDLLLQSFAPRRTIVLAFGFDEETGGLRGAAALNQSLVEEWGTDSFLFVLDEGGMGIQSQGDVLYAYPGVGEKGYYDVELTLEVKGGHSSRPPKHTGIGIMADAIVALEKEPYSPRLTQASPFRRVLECRTRYSPDAVQPWLRDALLSGSEEEVAKKLAEEETEEQWLVQTSQAVDVITGGVKVNALPEDVRLEINHRVALHESIQSINEHIQEVLSPVAQKYGLQFEGFNTSKMERLDFGIASSGILRIQSLQVIDPAPISPTNNGVWSVFSGTLRHVFESTESGKGKTVVPVGNIMTGNTDTVHYWNLTRNIYRFTPSRNGTRMNQHGIDERMGLDAHLEGIRLYYDLIRNFDSWNEA